MPGTVAGPGMTSSTSIQARPDLVLLAGAKRPHRHRHRHHAGRIHFLGRRPRLHAQARDRLGEGRVRAHIIGAALEIRPQGRQSEQDQASRTTSAVTRFAQGACHRSTGQRLHGAGQGTGCDQRNVSRGLLPSRRRRPATGSVTQGGYQDDQVGSWRDRHELEIRLRRRRQSRRHHQQHGREDRPAKTSVYRPRSARWFR